MLFVCAPKCFRINTLYRHTAPALATTTTIRCHQRRRLSSNEGKPPPKSAFASSNEDRSTLKIPDFSKHAFKGNPRSNQTFSYFMAGSLGLVSAVGAKATVQGETHYPLISTPWCKGWMTDVLRSAMPMANWPFQIQIS